MSVKLLCKVVVVLYDILYTLQWQLTRHQHKLNLANIGHLPSNNSCGPLPNVAVTIICIIIITTTIIIIIIIIIICIIISISIIILTIILIIIIAGKVLKGGAEVAAAVGKHGAAVAGVFQDVFRVRLCGVNDAGSGGGVVERGGLQENLREEATGLLQRNQVFKEVVEMWIRILVMKRVKRSESIE